MSSYFQNYFKIIVERETPAVSSSAGNEIPSNSAGGIGGTKAPQATGNDKVFPDDCGTDPNTRRGLLCFPDGQLCADRKRSH